MATSVPTRRRAPLPIQIMSRDLPRGTDDIERHRIVMERTRISRVNRRNPCTICGGSEKCIVWQPENEPTREYIWCAAPGEGDPIEWGFMGQTWYYERDRASGATRQTTPARESVPPASPETIARVLDAVLNHFGLSDAHRATLTAKRGYDARDIGPRARFRFASLPADIGPRGGVVSRLIGRGIASEAELLGTPGFSRANRNAPMLFLGRVEGAALLEPIIDAEGVITGFEYAPDRPMTRKGKPVKRLSPDGQVKTGRYGVSYPVHQAGRRVGYAEASHKANLACDTFGDAVVSIQGAGLYATIVQAARVLDPHKRRVHTVMLDSSEWAGKNEVGAVNALRKAGYRVELARWPSEYSGPDDALRAGATITYELPDGPKTPGPRGPLRVFRAYPWQRGEESQDARDERLSAACARITAHVRQHIEDGASNDLLVITTAPGIGKSTAVAAMGQTSRARSGKRRRKASGYDIGWIAERKEMAESLNMAALGYTIIDACTPDNCDLSDIHQAVAASGRIASRIHDTHESPCAYKEQFSQPGSAFYQLAHVQTIYPARHRDAIVIDELNLAQWLPRTSYSVERLSAAAATMESVDSTANHILRALQATITDAMQTGQPVTGRALFDLLDKRCDGHLAAMLAHCQHFPRLTTLRPYAASDITLDEARALPTVTFPHIWHALWEELVRWQRGGEWNSACQMGPATKAGAWAFQITERRQFGKPKDSDYLPPLVLLDATADAAILERLYTMRIRVVPEHVDPPPNMGHIAVRQPIYNPHTRQTAIKRYGKVSMTGTTHTAYNIRAAAEALHILNEMDPDGEKRATGRVGLITHQGAEREMAALLGIPYSDPKTPGTGATGHFWGMRGSNRMERCEILLIVGTPAMDPEDIKRLARALYLTDRQPLDETYSTVEGTWRYNDPRMQRVADAMSQAELTQCAHRNRALRYDHRTVITLCAGDVDFLPVTCEYSYIPQLSEDGELKARAATVAREGRLHAAIARLRANGTHVNVHTIAAEADMSLRDVSPWWQANKERETSRVSPVSDGYQSPNSIYIGTLVTSSNWELQDDSPQPAIASSLPQTQDTNTPYNAGHTTPHAHDLTRERSGQPTANDLPRLTDQPEQQGA